MPVILTATEEFDLWLEDETVEALKLQRPLAGNKLARIVWAIITTGEAFRGSTYAKA
jgi:putative SOS response-associated peptidase YedK